MSWDEESEGEENVQQEEQKADFIPSIELESEEIIKAEVVKEIQNPEGSTKVDYEKNYYERNKETIERRKEMEEAVAGIEDKELRLKKLLELQSNYQAGKFMGLDDIQNQQKVLELEKDFIRLAQKSSAKINEAKRPSTFTFVYLQNCLDNLLDTMPQDKINELLKLIKGIFNKKLKEEGNKKSSKKPSLAIKKITGRDDKKGVIYDDLNPDEEDLEEDNYEDWYFRLWSHCQNRC